MSFFLLWTIQMASVTSKEHRFGTRIVYGTTTRGFPVFWVIFPGCSRNSYGTSLNLWFQKIFIEFRRAPKMRDSVRLKSWENFLVTLPSISSETWVMYSSAIPGLYVFCHWLFLVFPGVSLETVPNFLSFLNVAIILKEKLCQLWRLK